MQCTIRIFLSIFHKVNVLHQKREKSGIGGLAQFLIRENASVTNGKLINNAHTRWDSAALSPRPIRFFRRCVNVSMSLPLVLAQQ